MWPLAVVHATLHAPLLESVRGIPSRGCGGCPVTFNFRWTTLSGSPQLPTSSSPPPLNMLAGSVQHLHPSTYPEHP